jgi:succinyl-CoA synthetase alpha subunit
VSILVNGDTRLIIYGISTHSGQVYSEKMLAQGTSVVAAVCPGRGGTWMGGVPVFDFVKEALHATNANAVLISVPAHEAAEAILESLDAEISLIVCATSKVPVRDMVEIKAYLHGKPLTLVGPGSPGIFVPGQCAIGAIAEHIVHPGSVGVLSRSGSLAYEVTWLLTRAGFGQSTILGIGDGLIVGTGFVDVLAMFEDDPTTKQIVLLGEIGGQEEELAAEFIRDHLSKPVVALVVGQTAPAGRRMGHQGAIIEGYSGIAQIKIDALARAGARVAQSPEEIIDLLEKE